MLAADPARGSMAGRAALRFAVREGRTRLIRSDTRPPLLVQRPLYLDERLPDMVFTYVANPTAGVLAGDSHCLTAHVATGSRVHLTTPAATRVFTMPEGSATLTTRLTVESGAYLEYLPEPLVPYRDANLAQTTTVQTAPGATAIVGDILVSGRHARGESLAFSSLTSRLRIEDASGIPRYHEAFVLRPGAAGFPGPGVFGRFVTPVAGTLLVITDVVPAATLLTAVRDAIGNRSDGDVEVGATALPGGAGIGVKALAADTPPVRSQLRAAWAAARWLLLDAPPPPHRKG